MEYRAVAARAKEEDDNSSGEGSSEEKTTETAGTVAKELPLSIQVQAMQNFKQSVAKRLKLYNFSFEEMQFMYERREQATLRGRVAFMLLDTL